MKFSFEYSIYWSSCEIFLIKVSLKTVTFSYNFIFWIFSKIKSWEPKFNFEVFNELFRILILFKISISQDLIHFLNISVLISSIILFVDCRFNNFEFTHSFLILSLVTAISFSAAFWLKRIEWNIYSFSSMFNR